MAGRHPKGRGRNFSLFSALVPRGLCLHLCMSSLSQRPTLFLFYFLIYVWKPGYSAFGIGDVGLGAQSVFSVLASYVCVCVCKSCAAKIPSGQTGPPTDCLFSFFSIDEYAGAGGALHWNGEEGLWLQLYSLFFTLTSTCLLTNLSN